MAYADNKDVEQPAHPVYSAPFCCLDSMMPIFAISKISTLLQTSVAEQTGLRLTWSQYPKADFLMSWLIFVCVQFQKELQKNMVEVVYPKFLATFEKGLESNGGKYFVGDSVSVKQYVLDPSLNLS